MIERLVQVRDNFVHMSEKLGANSVLIMFVLFGQYQAIQTGLRILCQSVPAQLRCTAVLQNPVSAQQLQ